MSAFYGSIEINILLVNAKDSVQSPGSMNNYVQGKSTNERPSRLLVANFKLTHRFEHAYSLFLLGVCMT